MHKTRKLATDLCLIWITVVTLTYPVAWFVSGVTVNGRCTMPTQDIILSCANQEMRAAAIRRWMMSGSVVLGLMFGVSHARDEWGK